MIKSSLVRRSGKFSSPFSLLLGVPQGSTLGPVLLNISINDFSSKINHSKFLLFADNLKIYRDMKSVEDCNALKVDIDAVQQWYGKNSTELNIAMLLNSTLMQYNSGVVKQYGTQHCNALKVDTDAVQQWCGKNSTELNIQKTKIIPFKL
jgi:hypothetical protein